MKVYKCVILLLLASFVLIQCGASSKTGDPAIKTIKQEDLPAVAIEVGAEYGYSNLTQGYRPPAGGLEARYDPNVSEELRMRDGLPNFFAKLETGRAVRIAYLGGSITAAKGWRPKSFAWFKAQYPNADLIEINAAISGTGSDFGACRIADDVLSQKPDLVFMEHRVNGGGGYEAKSVEGIIRQIRKRNPYTDICLIYTISQRMLEDIGQGKQTHFGAIMETAANVYGIPSIDLGVEIARLEKSGELIFKSNDTVAGKIVFSKDGTHPGFVGHDIYLDVIARSMLKMKSKNNPHKHDLPAEQDPRCWETAGLLPVSSNVLSEGWKAVDIETDSVYRDSFGRTHAMLRGAQKTDRCGATLSVKWNGTTIGFSDIPQRTGMEIEISVDGGKPVTYKRTQREACNRYSRFFYLPELAPGEHTAVLRVTKLPEGLSFYAGQILLIGNGVQQ